MQIERRRIGSTSIAAVAALMVASAVAASDVDRFAASTKTCESVINDDVKKELPKARNIEWDWDSIDEQKSANSVKLVGQGSYQGADKKRAYEFECVYDTREQRVASAWWRSSFDDIPHSVVSGSPSEPEGPSEADVTEACQRAVDAKVREDFVHKIRTVELIEDSIERSASRSIHKLEGQGRFLGGGGNWHRFEFTCSYDAEGDEVESVTWKHLGDEKNLD